MSSWQGPIFVIGDVHGCSAELVELLASLPLTTDCTIVFVGDYIDRGDDSRGVVEQVLKLRSRYHTVTLMGNHEDMFLQFLNEVRTNESASFIYNGGGATLASYGDVYGNYTIPKPHLDFYASLRLSYTTKDYVFVHAGLPRIALNKIVPQHHRRTLLWHRHQDRDDEFDWGKTVVHGHTPVRSCLITPRRINVDTGCVYGKLLTALQLPENKLFQVKRQQPTRHLYLKDLGAKRDSRRFDRNIPVRISHGENTLEFDTVNYSEFGMLICDVRKNNRLTFKSGDVINGTIGEQNHAPVSFKGTILRHQSKPLGNYYAIRFIRTPFEMTAEL